MKYLILIALLMSTAFAKPAKKTPFDKAMDQLLALRVGTTKQDLKLKLTSEYERYSFEYVYGDGGMPSDKTFKKILKLFRKMGFAVAKYEYHKKNKIVLIQITWLEKKEAVDLDD